MIAIGRNNLPRLAFVGPMVGRNAGYITTQGEKLADLFESAGYPTLCFSTLTNRYLRLADIVATLIRQRHRIDVVMLQVYSQASFVVEDIASMLARRFGHRIVMTLRGGDMPEFMARFPGWSGRVLGRADGLVTPSPFLAREVARYGFQTTVIPNVVNLASYPYRHRRDIQPRLFWMRSFYSYYNPLLALRALSILRRARPDATLTMAGYDFGIEAEVRRQAREIGLDGAVRFPGFLDMAGKAREGSLADIYLNTNRVDNMPVGVVEACAMGLPVVATAVGGIPDLLTDGETGLLVPDDDDRAMARAIERLLGDPDLTGNLSSNGRRLAERSGWESVRAQWEELFTEIWRT